MKAFTDYPIIELGDKSNKIARIRIVKIISYDGDKYCTVKVANIIKEIKVGYLYLNKGRCGNVISLPHEFLQLNFNNKVELNEYERLY